MNVELRLNKNNGYKFLFVLIWCQNTILGYLRGFIGLGVLYDILFFLIVTVCVLPFLLDFKRKISLHALSSVVWIVFSFLFTYVFANTKIIDLLQENVFSFFLTVFPYFFAGLFFTVAHNDKDRFYKLIYVLSCVAIICAILYTFYYMATGRSWQLEDNMNTAYNNMLSVAYIIWYMNKKTQIFNTVMAISGMVFMIAMGTRGAILALAIWFLVCFLSYGNNKTKLLKIFIIFFVGILMLLLMTGAFEVLLISAKKTFNAMGLNTRIFDYFITGAISDGNGREEIYKIAFENISYLPKGIYADVSLIGVYVHNLFLEVLIDYGYILGSVFILALGGSVFGAIRCRTDKDTKMFYLLLVCCILTKLMFSSSLFLDPWFFYLWGLSIQMLSHKGGMINEVA